MTTSSNGCDTFTVPIVSGPTREKLEKAMEAIERAARFKSECITDAAAKGIHLDYLTGDDDEYHDVILGKAYLSWVIKGRLINYRLRERAENIYKIRDNFVIEFTHRNRHTRFLSSPPSTYYMLDPNMTYDFRIVYCPETGVGRVSMLGRAAE